MKAYEIRAWGLENLKPIERPDPKPGPREVLVRIEATSLNYRDLLMAEGNYNPRMKLPVIPLSDGAGEVIETGAGVERVKVGDRVCALFAGGWISGDPDKTSLRSTLGGPLDGMLAELAVFSEENVVKIPEHLTYAEAATLPCAALTAWSALVTLGRIVPGDTILVLGTGGVSIFALQFGKLLGARVIVTSKSDEKLERARGLGADGLINRAKTPNWDREVYKLTGHRGADHVIEVGGAGTLEKSLRAVRPGGSVSLIGVLAGGQQELNVLPILMAGIRVQGVIVGHRDGFEAMNRAIAFHQMRPAVDRTFAFDQAPEAFRFLKSAEHFGKVGIRVKG